MKPMWYLVTDKENEFCHEMLMRLISEGEDPYKVMGFKHGQHDYYVDKLIKGLCPFSSVLFYRIVGRRPHSFVKSTNNTAHEYVVTTTCSCLEKE